MSFTINHNYGKEKALKMVKKAISGKFAIIKDNGYELKAGAPTAPVTIEVLDSEVTVSGKVMSKMFVDGIGNEIKLFFEENQGENNNTVNNNNSGNSNGSGCSLQEYFEYQEKGIKIIKSYKELLDSNIISEDEFNEKKNEILNFIKGIMEK